MAFKIITGSAMIITGLVSELMGLLFVILSSSSNSRLIAAGIFFTAGLPLLIFGFRMFRGGMVLKPELIKAAILKAAKSHNGKISKEEITAATGWDETVAYEIADMIKKRIAKVEETGGKNFYIFPEYQIKYKINKCPFCEKEYQVRDDVQKCPSCGGDLKFLKVKSAFNVDTSADS